MQKSQITNSKSQTNHKSQNQKQFWLLEFRSLKIIWNLVLGIWNFQKREAQNGFTLIEMAVATGIFAILVVSAVSVTISVTKAQATIQRIQTAIDNVRFSLELITKEMRVGSQYRTSASDCGPTLGSEGILFMTSIPPRERYYFLQAGKIMRVKSPVAIDGSSRPLSFPADCALAAPFTAEDVRVDRFRILLHGQTAGSSDGQPWATFGMKVTVLDPKGASDFSMDLQTSVVQRGRDFP